MNTLQLGLIQGNLRCFGANCNISRNTLFVLFLFVKIFICAIVHAFSISQFRASRAKEKIFVEYAEKTLGVSNIFDLLQPPKRISSIWKFQWKISTWDPLILIHSFLSCLYSFIFATQREAKAIYQGLLSVVSLLLSWCATHITYPAPRSHPSPWPEAFGLALPHISSTLYLGLACVLLCVFHSESDTQRALWRVVLMITINHIWVKIIHGRKSNRRLQYSL